MASRSHDRYVHPSHPRCDGELHNSVARCNRTCVCSADRRERESPQFRCDRARSGLSCERRADSTGFAADRAHAGDLGHHQDVTSSPAKSVQQYESNRRFQVWRYQVGHSQLLLRSVKSAAHASRIDVLFKGVDAIELPTSFDGLVIERDGQRYVLSGRGWAGSIVAGACFEAEDDGEYFDPSPFEASF
jgi:hypothetical protein